MLANEERATMKTVLIADDEPNMRLLVMATIEDDSYQVIEAADGEEAWALIQKHRPQLTILDMQMPGLTGIEVVRAIRADPGLCRTRVIMLTAKAQQADVAKGIDAGVDVYLTKPFSPLELLTAVEQATQLE
jgi:CheY-like chemotaxis protein